LRAILEVDRRRALLVDEEPSEPRHSSGEGDRIVGRALLDRYARWIELVGWLGWLGWLGYIVGTATGEQSDPNNQGGKPNAMAQHAGLMGLSVKE
jgi:hypothetical protein